MIELKSVIYKHRITVHIDSLTIFTLKYGILREGSKVINIKLIDEDFDSNGITKNLDKSIIGIPKIHIWREDNFMSAFLWTKSPNIDRVSIDSMIKLLKKSLATEEIIRSKKLLAIKSMIKSVKKRPVWKS